MSREAEPTTPDRYVQRAELLADLGRYDEAAAELGYAVALDPSHAAALTLLARVHLAAGRADAALTAADAAVAAAPGHGGPLVARGMALVDLRRFIEAARVAEEILRLGPNDAYAQRSAAAILAESRNGQRALDAAWRGVQLAPEDPQAHLVLAMVSARMELFDLAERAYREALRLDPELAEARHDIGVIRLEQRRYAETLEHLAEAAAMRPARSDGGGSIADALRRLILYGAGAALIAAIVVAFLAPASGAVSRICAALAALAGGLAAWAAVARLPGSVSAVLPSLLRADRSLAVALYATAAVPCLLLLYALIGTAWPLVLTIAATAVAEFAVLRGDRIR